VDLSENKQLPAGADCIMRSSITCIKVKGKGVPVLSFN
jgi:hypothetical protein